MSIPLESHHAQIEDAKAQEKRKERIALLSFSGVAAETSRKSLIEDIVNIYFSPTFLKFKLFFFPFL